MAPQESGGSFKFFESLATKEDLQQYIWFCWAVARSVGKDKDLPIQTDFIKTICRTELMSLTPMAAGHIAFDPAAFNIWVRSTKASTIDPPRRNWKRAKDQEGELPQVNRLSALLGRKGTLSKRLMEAGAHLQRWPDSPLAIALSLGAEDMKSFLTFKTAANAEFKKLTSADQAQAVACFQGFLAVARDSVTAVFRIGLITAPELLADDKVAERSMALQTPRVQGDQVQGVATRSLIVPDARLVLSAAKEQPGISKASDLRFVPEDVVARTYFRFRDISVPKLDEKDVIMALATRYGCAPATLGKRLLPATVLWQNENQLVHPNAILGKRPEPPVKEWRETELLDPEEYEQARQFIKTEYEKGKIKYEGVNYCMARVNLNRGVPQIDGYFGRYYDNILTQYGMEWELKKALLDGASVADATLPLRAAVEKKTVEPLVNGAGRCAAITISMLVVFQRPDEASYYFLICRRSPLVGVSAGMLHVIPAGMFEAFNTGEDWRLNWNLWRELLEEVYNEPEAHVITEPMLSDKLLTTNPIPHLRSLLKEGKAEVSVTGICSDLLNLRIEICSVLFVPDISFCEARKVEVNWEWDPKATKGGFARPWRDVDRIIAEELTTEPFVASGAVCLELGRNWIRRRHHL